MLEDRDYMQGQSFGRSSASGGWRLSPTIWIIVACVVGFIADKATNNFNGTYLFHAYNPNIQGAPLGWIGAVIGVFGYMFMHGDPSHLFWNMFVLFFIGRVIEQALSRRDYFLLFFGSGVFAGLAWLAASMMNIGSFGSAMVGASGALFAVLVAAALLYPNMKILVFFVIPARLKWVVLIYMIVTVYLTGTDSTSGTSHITHLAGAVGGVLIMFIFHRRKIKMGLEDLVPGGSSGKKPRRKRKPRHNPGLKKVTDEDVDPFSQVDPILDKIGKHGMKSLTEKEKRILEKARNRFKEKG